MPNTTSSAAGGAMPAASLDHAAHEAGASSPATDQSPPRVCDQHNPSETGDGYVAPAAPSGTASTVINRRKHILSSVMSAISAATVSPVVGHTTEILADDPIFAAIEHHRQAWRAGDKAADDEALDNVWSPQEEEAIAALCSTTPTTVAGIAALAAYIVENGEGHEGEGCGDESIYYARPVRLAEAIAIGAARIVGRSTAHPALDPTASRASIVPPVAGEDPAFAAVDRYRKAFKAFVERAMYEDDLAGRGVKLQAAPGDGRTAEMVAAVNESRAARANLAKTVPTTPQGLAALTSVVREMSADGREFIFDDGENVDEFDEQINFAISLDTSVRGMAGLAPWEGKAPAREIEPTTLAGVAALGAAALIPAASADMAGTSEPHPDSELLALGKQLDGLIKRYTASQAAWELLWSKFDAQWKRMCRDNPAVATGDTYSWVMNECEREANQPHPDTVLGAPGMYEMQCAILHTPATTPEGLAVKARLAAFTSPELWDKSDNDADWDHQVIRNLIDAVIEAAASNEEARRADVPPALPGTDPILDAIRAYQAGCDAYNALSDDMREDHEEEAIASTYGPPLDRLLEWDVTAGTAEGAAEALRLAQEMQRVHGRSKVTDTMIAAALAYLEGERPILTPATDVLGAKAQAVSTTFGPDAEPLVCDIAIRSQILCHLAHDRLTKAGSITLDEDEAAQLYFLICEQEAAIRELKTTYYAEIEYRSRRRVAETAALRQH